MYFTITTATNITVLSIQSLGDGSAMIKPTAVPYSTLMIVTMGSRVYLNLKLLVQRGQREAEGIPLSLSSQGSTPGSMDRMKRPRDKPADGGIVATPYSTPLSTPGFGTYGTPFPTPSPYVAIFPKPKYPHLADEPSPTQPYGEAH